METAKAENEGKVVIESAEQYVGGIIDSIPADHETVCRTLVASELVHDRGRLIASLRRLGVLVAETPPERSGSAVVNAWLDVKRRQVL